MATAVVGRPTRQRKKIAEKQLELRKKLWPDLDESRLWVRQKKDGFTTVPRSMPLFLKIMNELSEGMPLASTYLDLWCRSWDECFVTLNREKEMAFHAGFTGQRAVMTWRARMKKLAELGFIDLKPGPSGDMSYAIIWNPYEVIKKLHSDKHPGLVEDSYNALIGRASEIGADDLD